MSKRKHEKRILLVMFYGVLGTIVMYYFNTALASATLEEYHNRTCAKCNQHNFILWDTAETKCGSSDVFLLNLVLSRPNSTGARASIRKTWGSVKSHNLHNIKTVFVLGKTGIKSIDEKVLKEGHLFHDIVITDIQESYYKLTEKVLAALSWSLQNCQQFRYILKTDDDSFNNIGLFVNFIAALGYPENLVSGKCELIATGRQRSKKWYVSMEEYSGYYLPYFCRGPAYILARKTAAAFYQLSADVMYFKLEDVYLTGFVREKYGLEPVQMPDMYSEPRLFSLCYAPNVRSMHRSQPQLMSAYWNYTNSPADMPFYCTYIYDGRNLILLAVIFGFVVLLYFLRIRHRNILCYNS